MVKYSGGGNEKKHIFAWYNPKTVSWLHLEKMHWLNC